MRKCEICVKCDVWCVVISTHLFKTHKWLINGETTWLTSMVKLLDSHQWSNVLISHIKLSSCFVIFRFVCVWYSEYYYRVFLGGISGSLINTLLRVYFGYTRKILEYKVFSTLSRLIFSIYFSDKRIVLCK